MDQLYDYENLISLALLLTSVLISQLKVLYNILIEVFEDRVIMVPTQITVRFT